MALEGSLRNDPNLLSWVYRVRYGTAAIDSLAKVLTKLALSDAHLTGLTSVLEATEAEEFLRTLFVACRAEMIHLFSDPAFSAEDVFDSIHSWPNSLKRQILWFAYKASGIKTIDQLKMLETINFPSSIRAPRG